MVRKQNRKENLIEQATHSFKNKNGVMCYGMHKSDDLYALNPEQTQWIRIPKWAFNKYFDKT